MFNGILDNLKNAIGGVVNGVEHALGIGQPEQQAPQPLQHQPTPQSPVAQAPLTPQNGLNLGQLTQALSQSRPQGIYPSIDEQLASSPTRQQISQGLQVGNQLGYGPQQLQQIQKTPVQPQPKTANPVVGTLEAINNSALTKIAPAVLGSAFLNKGSLTNEAGQILSDLPAEGQGLTALPKIVKAGEELPEAALGAVKGVNKLEQGIISKGGVLSKLGPFGEQMAQTFAQQFSDRQQYTQQVLDNLKPFFGLKNADAEVVRNAVQSNDPEVFKALTPAQQGGVNAIRETMPQVLDRATAAGRNVGDLGATYFPRVTDWSKLKFGTSAYNDAIDHLVKSGQAADDTDAVAKLEEQRNHDLGLAQPTFGNFKSRDLDLPVGQVPAKQALDYYVRGAAHTTTQAENFGADSNKLHAMIAGVKSTGHDAGLAAKVADRVMHVPKPSALGSQVRGVFGLTRLSKAAIAHSTQLLNPSSMVGYGRTAGSLVKAAFKPEDWKWAQSTGINSELNEIRKAAGFEGVVGKGTAPALNSVMRLNRTTTAIAGRDAARAWAKAGRTDLLERILGVVPKVAGKLSPEEEVQAGRNLVQKTMFNHNPLDTPLWAETEGGRFVGQYRMQYGYKQTGFIYNSIVKEARNGNLAPLARFVLGVPLAGGAVIGTKSLITGNKPDLSPANVASQGGGGLVADAATQGPFLKSNPAGTVAGEVAPVAGEGVTIGQDTALALQGNSKPTERYGLKLIPLLGNRISAALVPNASPAAIAYAQGLQKASSGAPTGVQKVLADITGGQYSSSGQKVNPGTSGNYLVAKNLTAKTPDSTQALQRYYTFQKSLNDGDPLWKLPLNAPKGQPSVTAYLSAQAQYEGPEKTGTITGIQGSSSQGWYTDLNNARSAYFSKLPASTNGAAQEPAYPSATGQAAADLKTADGISNATQYSQFLSAHPDVTDYFAQVSNWQNQIRTLEGAPTTLLQAEKAPAAIQTTLNFYNQLPPSKTSGNTDSATNGERSAWIKANPSAYNAMSNFLAQSSAASLLKNAVEAVYSGQNLSDQALLKNVKSVGGDIASSGGTLSINPAAAYAASSGSSSSSSSSSGSSAIHLRAPETKATKLPTGGGRPKRIQMRFKVPHAAPVKPIRPTQAPAPRKAAPKNGGFKTVNDTIRST